MRAKGTLVICGLTGAGSATTPGADLNVGGSFHWPLRLATTNRSPFAAIGSTASSSQRRVNMAEGKRWIMAWFAGSSLILGLQ